MNATYVVRRVELPGWPQAFGVVPVIAGWPNPRPRAVFDTSSEAGRYRDRLNGKAAAE